MSDVVNFPTKDEWDRFFKRTGMTMRLIRNEIIEECAKIADEYLAADTNPGWDSACSLIARDIRALAVSSKHGESPP